MEKKIKINWNDRYEVCKYACILLSGFCFIFLLLTGKVIFAILAVICGIVTMLFSELSDMQHAIECHYRTSEICNEHLDVLNEENKALIEQIEEYKEKLLLERNSRTSAEKELKRVKKQMKQAGVSYVSPDAKQKNNIPRKRRSKNNEANNKTN